MNAQTARTWIGIAGAALLVGFFLPWIDVGPFGHASGLTLVRSTDGATIWRLMMLLVPIGGLSMIAFAIGDRRRAARLASLVTGVALVAYGAIQAVRFFFGVTGLGLWLVILGALAAMLVPLLTSRDA